MTVRLTSPQPTRRKVGYTEGFMRRRQVSTYLHGDGDRVVLLAPPGECAFMTPTADRELARCLEEHATATEARRHGRVFRFPRR